MMRFIITLCLGLFSLSGFSQAMISSDSSNFITEFLGARCGQIEQWNLPLDSTEVFHFSEFIKVYDFPIPVPYAIYVFNESYEVPVKLDQGFADAQPLSIPIFKYCNLAAVFFDTERPCFLLVEPNDDVMQIRFFQSCALHH